MQLSQANLETNRKPHPQQQVTTRAVGEYLIYEFLETHHLPGVLSTAKHFGVRKNAIQCHFERLRRTGVLVQNKDGSWRLASAVVIIQL